jgi:hypothetical protein
LIATKLPTQDVGARLGRMSREENQFALQPSTFKLWLKTGGAWVFQGVFKGFRIQGPYSAAAAYLANDIVSQDGSSYVALVDNRASRWQTLPSGRCSPRKAIQASRGRGARLGPMARMGRTGATAMMARGMPQHPFRR